MSERPFGPDLGPAPTPDAFDMTSAEMQVLREMLREYQAHIRRARKPSETRLQRYAAATTLTERIMQAALNMDALRQAALAAEVLNDVDDDDKAGE
jgi:CRP-like cAMP-binding protein